MKKEKIVHEPLFHIAKRDRMPWWQGLLVRAGAVGIALAVCLIFSYVIVDVTPDVVLKSFYEGNFRSLNKMFILGKDLSLLLLVALALTPAFKMRFWNIGGQGQILVGALAAIACAYYLGGKIPEPLLIVIMLVASIAAGAIWGFIPALFKALWNTNETLFTLMMNYIAIQLVAFVLAIWEPRDNSLAALSHGNLNFFPALRIGNARIGDELTVILIATLVTVAMFVYLRYSKQGYEVSVVGESENTARYIGIGVRKVVMRTMALSGMLCGIVGFLIVSVFDLTISTNTGGSMGFTAIMVSWLGKFNPFFMVIMSFIISFLNNGASNLVDVLSTRGMGSGDASSISPDFPSIVVGIILFFIVGCEFFINYKIKFKSFKGGKAK